MLTDGVAEAVNEDRSDSPLGGRGGYTAVLVEIDVYAEINI